MRRIRLLFAALALLLASGPPAPAQSVADFYKTHPITMLVGSGAGGGYDVYARAFAGFYSRHIPGHPDIIAQDMPAAAGLAAASALYTSAARDGTVIAALTNGAPMGPLFGDPGAHYDPMRFGWLGSIGKLENVCATWHTSPVKTIAQAQAHPVVVAAAGATSNTAIVPKMLDQLIGTKFKVIAGYDPASGLTMALEGGEAEGVCGLSWSTIKASRPRWVSAHLLNVLVQLGLNKLRDLPDVPSALDLVGDPQNKQVMTLILMRQEAGRPFAAPPDTPPDRLAALRQAFQDTLRDPDFVAEAQKLQLEIDPISAAAIVRLLKQAYATPPPIVQRAGALVEPGVH